MKTLTLKAWVVKHAMLKGLGIALAKSGIWLTLWDRTYILRWRDCSGAEGFSAGFGYARGWYMELGRMSFDISRGKLNVS